MNVLWFTHFGLFFLCFALSCLRVSSKSFSCYARTFKAFDFMPWVQWLLFPVPVRLSHLRRYHRDFHNCVGKSRLQSGPEVIKERLCHGKLEWKGLVFLSKCYIKQGAGFDLQGAPSGIFWHDTKSPLGNPEGQNRTWSISHLPDKYASKDTRLVQAMTWRYMEPRALLATAAPPRQHGYASALSTGFPQRSCVLRGVVMWPASKKTHGGVKKTKPHLLLLQFRLH